MNCKQANEISITNFLQLLGYQPIKTTTREFWYRSPLRDESTASFKVDIEKNKFKDFGTGDSGSLIDLAMLIWNCSVKDALERITKLKLHQQSPLSFQKQSSNKSILTIKQIADALGHSSLDQTRKYMSRISAGKELAIKKIQSLQNKALINYIESRGINTDLAQSYCQEIYIDHCGQNYFFIAFANDKGGYSLRNKYHKRNHGATSISTLRKAINSTVIIVEGFFDYLSAITIWPELSDHTAIVLNSVANIKAAFRKITEINPKAITLMLDNDEAGINASKKFEQEFGEIVVNRSSLYGKYKDVNDFLMYSLTRTPGK